VRFLGMMNFRKVGTAALVLFLSASAVAQARNDCASNSNLAHVHRRLDGAIDQLQHDQRDYAGHRVAAISDLQNARNEIVAAEQADPNCHYTFGGSGGSDANWGRRGQGNSNRDVWYVRTWVENMIDQLNRDNRDYNGHRIAAINDMQQARNQLLAAERSR
jgi:hypothetical protein